MSSEKVSEKKPKKVTDVWSVNIVLPSSWREKVEEVMKTEGYITYNEFIRALVRSEFQRRNIDVE